MGKIVSIDLDPVLLAEDEHAVGEHGRSLEELADVLATSRPRSRVSGDDLVTPVHENWARGPWRPGMSDSTQLIREDGDSR